MTARFKHAFEARVEDELPPPLNMDTAALRDILRPIMGELKDRVTHDTLPALCTDLGMPVVDAIGSKRDQLHASFDALPDADLPGTAQQVIERGFVTLIVCSSPRRSVQNERKMTRHAAFQCPPRTLTSSDPRC